MDPIREAKEKLKAAQDQLKKEKKEMGNLMKAYPKEALQGRPLNLSPEWKKAFVALISLALVNLDVSRKMSGLMGQISDGFDEAMKNGTPIQLTSTNKRELEITFMIKNYLSVTSEMLSAPLPSINSVMTAHEGEIDRDLFLYYVGTKANLLASLDEQKRVASDVDTTIALCFKEEIKGGLDPASIEKETLARMSTKEDILHILQNIEKSTGINIS